MRYVVIGAGAVGGALGGRLFESGHEVVLVARGEQYEAVREHGLHLMTPAKSLRLATPVVRCPADLTLRADDVLVLAVKTSDSAAALDSWAGAPVEGGGTAATRLPLVCAQNAVENERLALRRFRRVYAMCVWLPATHLEPGEVVAWAAPFTGMLHIGRFPGGVDGTAEAVAADLESSSFLAPVVPDVMRWKYGKLLSNLGNAIEAVCGPGAPGALALQQRAAAEGTAVLKAAGIAHVGEAERSEVLGDRVQVRAVNGWSRTGGSSWQSLARGTGSIESDHLNGEIVLLGRTHGVPTPVNETLQQVANRCARERRPPGRTTPAELTVLVEAAASTP